MIAQRIVDRNFGRQPLDLRKQPADVIAVRIQHISIHEHHIWFQFEDALDQFLIIITKDMIMLIRDQDGPHRRIYFFTAQSKSRKTEHMVRTPDADHTKQEQQQKDDRYHFYHSFQGASSPASHM